MNKQVYDAKATTDAYVDSLVFYTDGEVKKVATYIKNTHGANGLTYKVLTRTVKGEGDWLERQLWDAVAKAYAAELTLAAGADDTQTLNEDLVDEIKLQVKSAVALTPAEADGWIKAQK